MASSPTPILPRLVYFSLVLFYGRVTTSYPWPIGVLALLVLALGLSIPFVFVLFLLGYIRQLFVSDNVIPKGLEKFDE